MAEIDDQLDDILLQIRVIAGGHQNMSHSDALAAIQTLVTAGVALLAG